MEITFKGRHTSVPERFRRHASAKLAKLEKLDHNAIRIDVEVSTERNPRQADRSERVELTIRSRGPGHQGRGGGRRPVRGPRPRVHQARRPAAQGGRAAQGQAAAT